MTWYSSRGNNSANSTVALILLFYMGINSLRNEFAPIGAKSFIREQISFW